MKNRLSDRIFWSSEPRSHFVEQRSHSILLRLGRRSHSILLRCKLRIT
ncbi:hypothetical protein [Calothrix sp. NIES-2100]